MLTRHEICEAVSFLLESAEDRGTAQGILVYTTFLEMIESARDGTAVQELLGKLNHNLAGIEAHGDFTPEEYKQVLFLRSGDETFKS
ncbi:hypothetical protein [Gimesia panareensis]|uniref:hypothetical protein n=1 Tax=Gimesia panareensis TaxID=2527978 RepID=UPI00118B5FB7|nr:hypothetical protein [Gimesia panareensis]QDU49584.1 hypothetical protein Pan110_19220 [Gimesia panareensis]